MLQENKKVGRLGDLPKAREGKQEQDPRPPPSPQSSSPLRCLSVYFTDVKDFYGSSDLRQSPPSP